MTKHTLGVTAAPVSERIESSRKPVSSGHYRIVDGIDMTGVYPPVTIADKRISSGNIPAVLDPALASKRTLIGLEAATLPALPAVTVEAGPGTVQVPTRFSKPPSRKQTVLGLDISNELAELQKRRGEESQRQKALQDFLAKLEAQPFVQRRADENTAKTVAAVVVGFDPKRRRHCVDVVSVEKVLHHMMESSLPHSVVRGIMGAVREQFDMVERGVVEIVHAANDSQTVLPADVCDRLKAVAAKMAESLDFETKLLVDASTAVISYRAAAVQQAKAILDGKGTEGMWSLFERGWIPLGIGRDNSFRVIVK